MPTASTYQQVYGPAGPGQAAVGPVRPLPERTGARRLRQRAADREAGDRRTSRGCSRPPWNWRRSRSCSARWLGIPLGVLAAARRGRWRDHVVRVISLAGYSTPIFWFGMMGLLVFYAWLGWVGGAGRVDFESRRHGAAPITGLLLIDTRAGRRLGRCSRNALNHLILPASHPRACTRWPTSAA